MEDKYVRCKCGHEPRLIVEIHDAMPWESEAKVLYFVECPGCKKHGKNFSKTVSEAWQKWFELTEEEK